MTTKDLTRKTKNTILKVCKEPYVHITGPLIVCIIGSLIGFYIQYENRALSKIEDHRTRTEEIYNEVSRLMDDRFYKTRRVLSAHYQKDSLKIRKQTNILSDELEEWNASKHRIGALIKSYYGIDNYTFYRDNIQTPFANIGNTLLPTRIQQDSTLNNIRVSLEELALNIDKFNTIMQNIINAHP